ncbi:di-heme oxidoredictase family protein [Variovorax sp. J22R115]|uniref:di-heme oxidoredictase family protein n=1 Tax=Variovorax sp. J22R115 TaxID=3053509 RepID=UPI002576E7EB|nr:di-heme oxidoredictase family protein [Variovorax sp. J22R115]MDM0049855.1 di-heme oxidoredictase family protein [Variovorax sp. J22R115]
MPGTGTGTAPAAPVEALGPDNLDGYKPLAWADVQPVTQYTLSDGTLVTRVGGRTRDRHAREVGNGTPGDDPYLTFAPHYFERRTHELTIYENASPTDPANRILTIVMRPQWWMYGTNFRHSYIGRRDGDPYGPAAVALYGDNGGMRRLPEGFLRAGQELKTPVANYESLPEDPNDNYDTDLSVPPKDGEFVLVKQITRSAALNRPLRQGDLLEFELGIFLAGKQGDALGRFNYYAEAMVYQVGKTGVQPWYRGPCCGNPLIPWDSRVLPTEAMAGGAMMTSQEDTSNQPDMLFLQAGTNIAGINIQPFVEGRRLFHTSFLTGTHAEAGNPTLFNSQAGKAGPRFQQAACIACHTSNAKSSPGIGLPLNTMVVLTGDSDGAGNLITDGRFGGRLAQGQVAEGGKTYDGRQAVLKIDRYEEVGGQFADRTPYTLQKPHYTLTDTSGKPLELPPRMSVRTAPHLAGMGLLEAVSESTLEALATASKGDPDGAVGKLQIVTDLADPSVKRVGRFGWRGTSASVMDQTAVALNADMGVTTRMLPTHICGKASSGSDCRTQDGKGPELSDADLELLVRYTSLLAVPAARHFEGEQPLGIHAEKILAQSPAETTAQVQAENAMQVSVARGRELFVEARCTACHVATLQTGGAHRFAELRRQTIRPYTDLLLHDMGEELADTYPQGRASPQEWRTAPLWGLGLLERIDAKVRYLHDGRARTVEEAILWHGGQGKASRERFKTMNPDDRRKVIDFIKSL